MAVKFARAGVRVAFACLATFAAIAATVPAQAQTIERHLPPAPQGSSAPISVPDTIPADQDATPIGPALRAIVILGPREPVHAAAADGIEIPAASRLAANRGAARAALSPFLDRPLSRKLIAAIEAAITLRYRAAGYPFLAVSTPEQEISSGVLQIRVIEFAAGQISTRASSPREAEAIAGHIGLKTGDAIDARALNEDLAWLGRYPYRRVGAVFTPGSAFASADLILAAEDQKPWQVYGGYANSGTEADGVDRYFIGAAAGDLLGRDSVLSYQGTGSQDAFGGAAHPHYVGHAVSYVLPWRRHGQFELSLDSVRTEQSSDPFTFRQTILEASLGYRFAIGNLFPGEGLSDVRAGVEARTQRSATLFGGALAYDTSMNVYQVYLGYHYSDAGLDDLDIALHVSPGNIDRGNGGARILVFSQGRETTAAYGYVTANYHRTTTLPLNLALVTQVMAQWASTSLPRTEQAALGGASFVRGYNLDDGAYDNSAVLRNTLRIPGRSFGAFALSPYGFADLGYGDDKFSHQSAAVASAGVGLDARLSDHALLSIDIAEALAKAPTTRAGKARIEVNFSLAI